MQEPTEGRITGFPPRPDILWRVGKTAASIRFVDDASAYLAAGYGTHADRRLLGEAIDALKTGARSLASFMSIDLFVLAGSPAFWHLGKTGACVKFVLSARRRIASGRADETEAQMLGAAIEAVLSGERTLTRHLSVDDFLVGGFPLPWEEGKTEASKRFVREAEMRIAAGAGAEDRQMLREAADAVKNGERSLDEHLPVETFLVSGFPQ